LEKPQDIEYIFKRYLLDQCSPDEIKWLAVYFSVESNEVQLKDLIRKEFESGDGGQLKADSQLENKMAQVLEKLKKQIYKK
jgi:hypothetical protein